MLQVQLNFDLVRRKNKSIDQWLYNLASVYTCRPQDRAKRQGQIYFSKNDFQNLLANTERSWVYRATQFRACSAPSTMRGSVALRRPQATKLKGMRNKMSSIPSPIPSRHKRQPHYASGFGQCPLSQAGISEGKIKCGRLIKRASGWYLCLS